MYNTITAILVITYAILLIFRIAVPIEIVIFCGGIGRHGPLKGAEVIARSSYRFESYLKINKKKEIPDGEGHCLLNSWCDKLHWDRYPFLLLYGDCSSIGRAFGCDPRGSGIETHLSP